MKRTRLIAGAAAMFTAALLAIPGQAQTVALTFDDGPTLEQTPRLSPRQRNQALLDALARHRVKAALFVTAGNGASQPAGYALAKAWGDAGHALGNHTMTHPDLDGPAISLAQYEQEILDCDAVIRTLPNYRKWFRYTFLHQGLAPAKHDGMQAFLRQHGYRDAPVSFDGEDWVVADKLTALLKNHPDADIAPMRQAYLDALRKNATASLSKGKGKDEVKILLLHHNLANALWLDDIITMFEAMGWKFANPEQAFPAPAA